MGAYRNFFKQFRLQNGEVPELNREFDLVKTAFGQVQVAIDRIDKALGITDTTITPTAIGNHQADLYLSFMNQNGTSTLPVAEGGEADPDFYLRPDTDQTVVMTFTGVPGSTWEYKLGEDIPTDATVELRIQLYYCALTPQPSTTASLIVYLTKNSSLLSPASPNLDGMSGGIEVGPITHGGFVSGDVWGIRVVCHNVSSGALSMTAHATARWSV